MENNYLQLDFGTGKFYQWSKEKKEGYDLHTSSKGTESYRKYFDKGVTGTLESASLYDAKFGQQISLRIKNGNDIFYAPIALYDQKNNVDTYAKSLIAFLPNLKKGMEITISGYNFVPKEEKYSKIGVSIKSGEVKIERAFPYSDAPKLEFVAKRGSTTGKKAPTAVSLEAHNNFYLDKLEESIKPLIWEGKEGSGGEQKPEAVQPETKAPAAEVKKEEVKQEVKLKEKTPVAAKKTEKKAVEAEVPKDDQSDLPF